MFGLYVHIPFCAAICNYCNFNRGLFDGDLKTRYVQALIAEITRAGRAGTAERSAASEGEAGGASADTIYFGGGTPSLLAGDDVAAIIGACRDAFNVTPDAEITLEANPETVTSETLKALRDAGVNRLSFGVQSFRDEELRRLTRLHGVERAKAAYRDARGAGFDNVSLDLMMWLPGQQVSDWLESVDQAIALRPEHLSLYMLEVYPNAPLREDMARAAWSQAPDEDVAVMYTTSMERLEAAGYQQYEISNVARPGRQSRHNLKYWTDGEWFGFGCGAHGTIDGVRTKNVSGIADYIDCIVRGQAVTSDVRRMDADERLGDALFTGLRLVEGLDLDAVQNRYGVDVWRKYGAELARFLEAGVLRRDGRRLALTRS